MLTKRASETVVTMAQVVEPNDANFLGKAFGGAILARIDLCAYATASKFAGTICVTASLDRVDFHSPIDVGDLVTMTGIVTYVGKTSVEVTIQIFAEDVLSGARRHTNTARLTMVAIKDGKPAEVPRLLCETREEKVAFLTGKIRRERRRAQAAEFEELVKSISESDNDVLDRLLGEESSGR